MDLFQQGNFTLHSGDLSMLKIDCDALTNSDWDTLAALVAKRFPFFKNVVGIPTGGERFAEALKPYITTPMKAGIILLVDDVLTTGASMEEMREKLGSRGIIGVVAFARKRPASWIYPIFQLGRTWETS